MLTKEVVKYMTGFSEENTVKEWLKGCLANDRATGFDYDAAKALAAFLEYKLEIKSSAFAGLAEELPKYKSPLSLFLQYGMILGQDRQAACGKLSEALELLPKPDIGLLLERAKLYTRMEKYRLAAADLKTALSLSPAYSFYVNAEKTIDKIINKEAFTVRRKVKIALLGSSTTAFLAPVIRAESFLSGIAAEVYEGAYGNWRQEVLDDRSSLYAFKPDVVIILLNHHDLGLGPENTLQKAEEAPKELKALWTRLQGSHSCHIVQAGFSYPPDGAWGLLEELGGGRNHTITKINSRLAEGLPAGVSFLDMAKVQRRAGEGFYSAQEWHNVEQYPALECLPLTARYMSAHIRAAFGLAAKVLVTDLDNTLWGGVVGEEGADGVEIGQGSPVGEAHLDLQKYMKELAQKGVLLAVCSKNNKEDAKTPFKERPEMLLKLDDFVMFEANWQDKAENIKNIAQTLSLGLDSFVFLDDNPLERALVRKALPEVTVPEGGSSSWEMLAALRNGQYFDSIALTEEDKVRQDSYKQNMARQEFEKTANTGDSLEDFLQGLDMVAECGAVDEKTLTRVTQLINKTNQFNLTTRRYTQEQVRKICQNSEGYWTKWYRLKDRFGDQGLIGVVIVKKETGNWHIDTLLMSCRVLGRQMEEFIFADILRSAKQAGVSTVSGEYIATAKNVLVKDLLPRMGFVKHESEEMKYVFDLSQPLPECGFISINATK